MTSHHNYIFIFHKCSDISAIIFATTIMSISRITNPWKIPMIAAFLDKERPWPMLVVRPEMHSIRPGRMLILSENHEFTGTATISKYWRHGVIMRITSDDNQLELLLYARYTQMILSFWMYLLMWFYIITRRCDKGHVNDLISGTYYFSYPTTLLTLVLS